MEDGDLIGEVGEAGFETADGLGGEGDFRDEDEDGFLDVQGGLCRLEVDFGFPGAGDAEEEVGGRGRGLVEGGGDLVVGLLLLGVQGEGAGWQDGFAGFGVAADFCGGDFQKALRCQGFHGGGGVWAKVCDGQCAVLGSEKEAEDEMLFGGTFL